MGDQNTKHAIITFTTLYPNEIFPRHGIFVEERLKHLLKTGKVDPTIVAPVPWFPLQSVQFGEYGKLSRIPKTAKRLGLAVCYPRYLTIPKIGMTIAPILMSLSLLRYFRFLKKKSGTEFIIDAHYLYPDGVAACLLGKWLNIPVVMTARGSDLNVFPRYRNSRKMIQWAIGSCARLITVSESLRHRAIELGAPPNKVITLRNGVDLERFQPTVRTVSTQVVGSSRLKLLSVGNLVDLKGHDLAVKATAKIKDASLTIIGEGPLRKKLENLIDALNIGSRVSILPNVAQEELAEYYTSADILVLPSKREGMPNVVLESLACGTPVVATNAGGVAELVSCPEAGIVIEERNPDALVAAIERLSANLPNRSATRRYAESLGWTPTINGLIEIFDEIATRPSSRH